jgi:hypothetical protein
MAAFTRYRWGRYVFVSGYRRYKNGKWEHVCSHLRSWPGDTGQEYFLYA